MEVYESEHQSRALGFQFEHTTQKDRMYVIKISFTQMGWFHWSKAEWNSKDCDITMWYMKPFIPKKITATCNILNHTPTHSTSHLASIVVVDNVCSQSRSINISPLKTANMASPGSLFGMYKHHEDISAALEYGSPSAIGNDIAFGKQTNQNHPLHGYGSQPSQHPFPSPSQIYQHSSFNMTQSLQPTTSVGQGYPGNGPQWQEYYLK